MLATNHICNLQSQNFKLMQQKYMKTNLTGDNISVMYPLRQMLADNSKMAFQFASEAYKVLILTKKCKESDFQDAYEQLATYGVTMSNLFLSYNTKTFTLALYTSSYTILNQLASQGILKGKKNPIVIELQGFKDALVESDRVKNSIKKGDLIQAVRLDPEIYGNTVVFTGTVPRSQLDMNSEVIIPFQAMDFAMGYINQILQEKMLRFTMGDKVRVVTKNYQALAMIYGEARARFLVSRTYDPRIESFYLPSVGASIYSAGITNIKLVNVDKIEVLQSIDGVDLSEIRVDYSMAKEFFEHSIKSMKAASIHKLGEICSVLSPNLTAKETYELVKTYPDKLYDKEVYDLMKKHPDLFDMQAYKNIHCKYGSLFEQLDPVTSQYQLAELLKTGVFKILINSRKGGLSTIIVTNSPKELARVYGKTYYSKYESEGNRLRALSADLIKSYPNGLDSVHLQELTTKHGLVSIFTSVVFSLDADSIYSVKTVEKHINMALFDLENRKTVISQPNLVTCRNCDAKMNEDGYVVDFYKNIDFKSILSIVRLSKVATKKDEV